MGIKTHWWYIGAI